MSQFHVVTRPFDGAQPYHVGDIVDAESWRYARQLVERRFMRPATEAEVSAATAPAEVAGVPTKRYKTQRLGEEATDAE